MQRSRSTNLVRAVVTSAALCGAGAAIEADAWGGLQVQPTAGQPLPGLTSGELERFAVGQARFSTIVQVADGLGPVFNKAMCSSCHIAPIGGWGPITVTYFGAAGRGGFDPMEDLGGPLLQSSSISAECLEYIPDGANVVALRVSTSSLAAGLIEAIPDAAILAHADPNDDDGDGVSGRARLVTVLEAPEVLRVGRFGWKAQLATVRSASANEARDQLGLTSSLLPDEHAPNGDLELLAACDDVADPEAGQDAGGFDFIDRVTDFQRFLAPPPQTPRSGMAGETLFDDIGCAVCHVPAWQTMDDPSLEAALRNQAIRPYSDFLLHDMGLLGDGFPQGDADEPEMRTPTLWNLRTRPALLHDGRVQAGSFAERMAGAGGAIWWHDVVGSEAQGAAARFFALSEDDRSLILSFLDSLGRREFDHDGDGAVDLVDFIDFTSCHPMLDVTPDDACAVHDVDQDGAITLVDFELFLSQYDGANGDCDGDGISNLLEILVGSATDTDNDGFPDECPRCPADLDGDGHVGGADLGLVLAAWGACPGCAGDVTGDGHVDGADLGVLLGAWGDCG